MLVGKLRHVLRDFGEADFVQVRILMRGKRVRLPTTGCVSLRALEQLASVQLIFGFRLNERGGRRRRVDKHGIATVVQQHGCAHRTPCVLVHQLKFVED